MRIIGWLSVSEVAESEDVVYFVSRVGSTLT